jgi:hypothetical protein
VTCNGVNATFDRSEERGYESLIPMLRFFWRSGCEVLGDGVPRRSRCFVLMPDRKLKWPPPYD